MPPDDLNDLSLAPLDPVAFVRAQIRVLKPKSSPSEEAREAAIAALVADFDAYDDDDLQRIRDAAEDTIYGDSKPERAMIRSRVKRELRRRAQKRIEEEDRIMREKNKVWGSF